MHWLLLAKDKPGVGERRQTTRQAHRAYIWRRDLPARLLLGAPLAADDEGAGMSGTWLLLSAPNREAVETFAAGDPYAKADLFDEVRILPLNEGFDPAAQLASFEAP